MKARIRTIKPEIAKDEDLWDLEVETGLPVYRAFTVLWCYADREGRFEWRPRQLKVDLLPYWEGDFSRVLDALGSRGFIRKYTSQGREYGVVCNFLKHQFINGKEPMSELPAPPEIETISESSRVVHALITEEKHVNDVTIPSLPDPDPIPDPKTSQPDRSDRTLQTAPPQPSPPPRIAAPNMFPDPTPGQGTPQTQNASSVAPSASNPIPRGFGGDPRKRPDVQELHAVWQSTFGMPPTKFRGGHSDQSADTLALAIDACGLEACKLALKHAATEPGVKGELDGSGNVHSSIRYLFGNEDTLPRLLKHAEDRERRVKPAKMTKGEALLKLASLPPDSEEAAQLREKLKRAEEREQSSWQPSSVMGSGLR